MNFIATTKPEIIQNILRRTEYIYSKVSSIEQIKRFIKCQQYIKPAPAHDVYVNHFNFIDKIDRYWYSVQETHGNHRWRSKLLFSILRFAMQNVWIWHIQASYEPWQDFRKTLALELANFNS